MRKLLFAITAALAVPALPALADATKPSPPAATAATKVPVPKDATAPEEAPGGGGKILMYQVPRGRTAVIAEMRELFKKGKWEITKDDPSPSGRAIRLELKKDGQVFKVSFTGDDTRTAIIVTNP